MNGQYKLGVWRGAIAQTISKKKFQKSVESTRYQIIKHYQKIADEEQKLVPDRNLINYWRKEIVGLEKS